jgi:hypothetical protein
MRPIYAFALALMVLLLPRAAAAADWGYCIAPSEADNRIYMSMTFRPFGSQAEADFDASLQRRGLRHSTVQCARANDEESATVMRRHAVEVNRLWGRQVIDLQWRPSP